MNLLKTVLSALGLMPTTVVSPLTVQKTYIEKYLRQRTNGDIVLSVNGSHITFGASGNLHIECAGGITVHASNDAIISSDSDVRVTANESLITDYQHAFHHCTPELIEHVLHGTDPA